MHGTFGNAFIPYQPANGAVYRIGAFMIASGIFARLLHDNAIKYIPEMTKIRVYCAEKQQRRLMQGCRNMGRCTVNAYK